jgi:macrolide-specific efflux system membrane fusion protein
VSGPRRLPAPAWVARRDDGRRDPRRRRIRRIAAAAGAVLLLGGGLAWWRARRAEPAPQYREHVVKRGDLVVSVSAAGEVTPQNRIELTMPVSGRIDRILVREGDRIAKGQVVAWISSNDRAALLDAARAKGPEEVARWEDAYKPTPLIAPLAGFIIARRAEPGQSANQGSAPLVMADRLIVRAQVDETDLAKIAVGQRAEVVLDAYPGAPLPGRLDHIAYESRQVNNVTVYDIEVEPRRAPPFLRSGMTATVSVVVAERKGVFVIPAEAFSERNGQLGVLVKRSGGEPEWRPVEIGLMDAGRVEAVKGVSAGEILLISTKGLPPSSLSSAGSPFSPPRRGRWR